jgi:tetratricopeptide (TPR) repeat protein
MQKATSDGLARVQGPDDPQTLVSRGNLACTLCAAGQYAEAIEQLEPVLQSYESKFGPDLLNTITMRSNLATAYAYEGRTTEAIRLHEGTLKLLQSKFGPDDPNTLISRNNLAEAYIAAEALVLHESTLKLMESKFGPDHDYTIMCRKNLATANEALGRWDRAEPLLREMVDRKRKTPQSANPALVDPLPLLGLNLIQQAKWSEAEPVLRECLAVRLKTMPDAWNTFNTRSQLGGALLGQGKYAEAESLVVEGYEGMKTREATIPATGKPRLTEAAERLVRLYEQWGRPDEAAAWKARLGVTYLDAMMPNGAAAFAR